MTSLEQSANRWTGERVALGLVAAITLIGLGLRLPSFGDSLFGDELSAYFIVAGHSFGQMMHLLNGHSTELNPLGRSQPFSRDSLWVGSAGCRSPITVPTMPQL